MEIDVLEAAQGGVEIAAEALRHIGDARTLRGAMRLVGHVAVKDRYTALLNDPDAGDQSEQSRLSDAIRTNHADHAASRDLKGYIVECNRRPVVMGDVLDLGDGTVGHCGSFTTKSAGHGTAVSVRTKPMPRTPVFTWL